MLGVLKMLLDGSVLRNCYLQYPIENNVAYECNGLIVFMFLCFLYKSLAVRQSMGVHGSYSILIKYASSQNGCCEVLVETGQGFVGSVNGQTVKTDV